MELIGKAVKGEYTIQKGDIGKYLAVTIAISDEIYAGSSKAYITEAVQPKTITAAASIKDKVYDGDIEAEVSEITLNGVKAGDEVTAMAGDAVFEDANAGDSKEVTVSDIVLRGTDASCYKLEQDTIKATSNITRSDNTPNMPDIKQIWNVSRNITEVSKVNLPTDWIWLAEDAKKELPIDSVVKATAVYNGKDKGNYITESVEISIQRSSCTHEDTEIRDAKPASCTEAGYSGDSYCKSCEQFVSAGSSIAALGHSFTEYKENGDATCTEDGTKTAKCDRCEETKTVISEGSKTGHIIVIDPAVEAGCTSIGKTEGSHCSACGEVLEEQKAIAALGHDYTSQVTKEPTVTETGIRTYTCSRCDDSYTEEISKLPEEEHKHSYTQSITKEPTCTVEGVTTFVCSCGDQYTEAIKALGHDYKTVITKPATETETGIKTYTCNRCDDSYTEEIPKLPEEEHKHQYTEKVTKEPDCTEAGLKTFTCSCGEEYTEAIEALGHNYTSVITKPATTAESGIRTFTCSNCGNEYTEEIPKLEETQRPNNNTGSNSGTNSTIGNTGNSKTQSTGNNTGNTNNSNTTDNTDNTGTVPPETTDNNSNETQTPNQTVVTETKPDGTKVETTTETKTDGTVKETVTETKTDGTVKETVTETKTDGTVKESVTEKQNDGTTVSLSTETKTDGSVTSTKEIQLEDKSASLFTVVETATDGKVNANSVIRTGLSDTSDTVNISEELLKDVAADERLSSIVVEITDTTVNSATKESKKTVVNVNIPSIEGVEVEKVVLTKDSIDAAKNTGKGLVVNVVNGCADEGTINNYKVTIPAKQLAKIDSSIQEINVEIIAEPVTNVSNASKKNAITKIVNKNNGKQNKTCVVSLASNKEVKAGMNVTIPVTDKTKISKGSKVYVYKYNAKTGKLVETANCKKTVSADGTVTIAASSGSEYVVSAKKLSGNKVKTIKDDISVSVSKKTAKVGKELEIKVSLPSTVSTKSKFGTEKATITYKSSDSKIASISKDGVITTKQKGTVVVTITVKLASGQKVTEKQKIVVK